jgi:hypothetical protein
LIFISPDSSWRRWIEQSLVRIARWSGRSTIAPTSPLDNSEARDDCSHLVSVLFFKRFLQRPFQIASIIPSSKALVERVASKMDFTGPRVIAEYGPGEGVHSREIARRMSPDSHLLLFELDAAFSRALERQFAGDARVHVIHGDAASLPYELKRRGIACCDYILSAFSRSTRNVRSCEKRTMHSRPAAVLSFIR